MGSSRCPALRLRGLYLALATLAFGVFVSDMILADIAPHVLPVFHLHFSIFDEGTLQIPPLKLGPVDLSSTKTFLTTSVCVFILVGIGLIALRRSNYGRRLTAMKDSPAAAATLGQNVVKLKLSVFMLSAAIAGLGGVLLSAASASVTANTYIIFISLALVMLTVVGGIGSVAGALMGGILAGTAFTALTSTFTNLARITAAGASGTSWPTCPWWPRPSSASAWAATPAEPCHRSWPATARCGTSRACSRSAWWRRPSPMSSCSRR